VNATAPMEIETMDDYLSRLIESARGTAYVVGRWRAPGSWELEAVYATEPEARAACDEPDLFFVPMALGHRFETSAERRDRIARGEDGPPLPAVYPREGDAR
jgi:hypothetical protein